MPLLADRVGWQIIKALPRHITLAELLTIITAKSRHKLKGYKVFYFAVEPFILCAAADHFMVATLYVSVVWTTLNSNELTTREVGDHLSLS